MPDNPPETRRYPVALDAATQINLPQAEEFLEALKNALDPDNHHPVSITIQTSLTQAELHRLAGPLPLADVYCRQGSDEHGWTINLRAADLLDCERANSAQIIAITALSREKRQPRDYDTITPQALDFLADLVDEANGDEFRITPELAAQKAAEHGITLDDLAMPPQDV